MTLLDDFNAYVSDVSASSLYKKWASGSPGEVTQWQAVVAAIRAGSRPALPTFASAFGRSLIDEARLYLDATAAAPAPAPTPTPTPTPTPAPSPIADYTGLVLLETADLAKAKQLTGVTRVRADWYRATDPAYLAAAKSLGIDVLPIACYSMGQSSRGDHFPPDDYAKWSAGVASAVKANGWPAVEVWNEPWLGQFWGPAPDPAAYLNLVKACAAAVWAVSPSTLILVSADTIMDGTRPWRTALLTADTTGLLKDPRIRPTTHCYCEARTPTTTVPDPSYWDFDRYKYAYQDFKAHGHPDPQVWVTEYGWGSGPDQDNVGEQNQAAYTVEAVRMMQASGMVERAYCFYLKSGDSWSYDWLRPDGTPKPVCAAVKGLA